MDHDPARRNFARSAAIAAPFAAVAIAYMLNPQDAEAAPAGTSAEAGQYVGTMDPHPGLRLASDNSDAPLPAPIIPAPGGYTTIALDTAPSGTANGGPAHSGEASHTAPASPAPLPAPVVAAPAKASDSESTPAPILVANVANAPTVPAPVMVPPKAPESPAPQPLPEPTPPTTPVPGSPESGSSNGGTTTSGAPPQANTDPNGKTGPAPKPAPKPSPAPGQPNHSPEKTGPPDKLTRFKPVLDLIASKESGGNYNAYFGQNKYGPKDLVHMTVGQVLSWQYQYVHTQGSYSSAAGRYQFVRGTLQGLVQSQGISLDTPFSPELQDRLAMVLVDGCGTDQFLSGQMGWEVFANHLAHKWASLPRVLPPNPESGVYDGDGVNHSLISIDQIHQALTTVIG